MTANATSTQHTTTITDYTDPATPGETWYRWDCTCGAGTDHNHGTGPVWAADLARTHILGAAPCTCGNPTITLPTPGPWVPYTASLTCDCGYAAYARVPASWVRLGGLQALTTRARGDLAAHHCASRACRGVSAADARVAERAQVAG